MDEPTKEATKCCCPSADARMCYLIRYGDRDPQVEEFEPEQCECGCHREDSFDEDDPAPAPQPPAPAEPQPMPKNPGTFCDEGEHRHCYDCGIDLAGKQAHFDEQGDARCPSCDAKIPPATDKPYLATMADRYAEMQDDWETRGSRPLPQPDAALDDEIDGVREVRLRALAEKLTKTADPATGNLEGVMAVAVLKLLNDRALFRTKNAKLLAELAHVRAMLGAKDLRSS